jgi:hypothetical protein
MRGFLLNSGISMAKEIDVETDKAFQKKDWRAERIMWSFMLLFVLAGISGLFGRGGLSDAKAGSEAEKITVKYERFLRYHTQDRLDISLFDIPKHDTNFRLEIDKAYIDKIQLEDIHPTPQNTLLTANGIAFIFENKMAGKAKVIFYLKPDRIGNVNTAIKFNNNHVINISQFIYP